MYFVWMIGMLISLVDCASAVAGMAHKASVTAVSFVIREIDLCMVIVI